MSPFKDFDLDIVKVTATSGMSPRTEDPQTDACGAETMNDCDYRSEITCMDVTCTCPVYSVDECLTMEGRCED